MDLYNIIRQLHRERERLNRLIAVLENYLAEGPAARFGPPKRRGRKTMPPEERRQVSNRMRAYWAKRRQEKPTP